MACARVMFVNVGMKPHLIIRVRSFALRKGNEFFKAGDFPAAIRCYSDAIAINGENHVYFGNRRLVLVSQQDENHVQT